jgi:multifunctional methyltransferase subunit TRM112
MKLITHNILMCNKKGCTKNNFPLKLAVKSFSDFEPENAQEFSPALMHRLLDKIDWPALRSTVQSVPEWSITLPEQVTQEMTHDEKFLQELHLLLVRRQIVDGEMRCPNCDRVYEIKNGIANMLLLEDEV